MKLKKLAGNPLKRAIIMSEFLPDHPEPFRREQVMLALEQAGYTAFQSTLDDQLMRLVRQGYLERSTYADGPRKFHWYRFSRKDRTSTRPGYGSGERYDVMR